MTASRCLLACALTFLGSGDALLELLEEPISVAGCDDDLASFGRQDDSYPTPPAVHVVVPEHGAVKTAMDVADAAVSPRRELESGDQPGIGGSKMPYGSVRNLDVLDVPF